MNKEVLISIRGLQFEEGTDENKIETITAGDYYKKNDYHYVVYDELTEGFEEPTKNIIKFNDKELYLTKHGLVNVHMVFEENRKNMTNYVTPYGSIMIGIETEKVDLKEEEKRIRVDVLYSLEVNYEHLADCNIVMDIREKKDADISLYS
ncbi:MAG: DUF1934 domain-containing protein [Lachnospiraceae bacterium]|nr:DUF1934 domain-containing protein [Lachnospiraceae bacterium]